MIWTETQVSGRQNSAVLTARQAGGVYAARSCYGFGKRLQGAYCAFVIPEPVSRRKQHLLSRNKVIENRPRQSGDCLFSWAICWDALHHNKVPLKGNQHGNSPVGQ